MFGRTIYAASLSTRAGLEMGINQMAVDISEKTSVEAQRTKTTRRNIVKSGGTVPTGAITIHILGLS